jgi:hypothetical protein
MVPAFIGGLLSKIGRGVSLLRREKYRRWEQTERLNRRAKVEHVVHCEDPGSAKYIGRPSKWGNPYVIGKDGTREEVIAKYEEWLLKNEALLADLDELRGYDLLCWCTPLPCHGDVLIKLLERGGKRGDDEKR